MARLRSIRHPLRRMAQVSGRRRALVVEAVLGLMLARAALVFLSFPALAGRLGTFSAPQRAAPPTSSEATTMAQDIGWAVTRAARYLPFRAVCLPQAMAARMMLKRRGIASVMHFGALPAGQDTLNAHAWIDAAGVEVTGYPLPQGMAEIACFV